MKKILIIAAGLLISLLIWAVLSIYPDWLWFENLHFSSVFWTTVFSKAGLGVAIWLIFIAISTAGLFSASRLGGVAALDTPYPALFGIPKKAVTPLFFAIVLVISFYIASKGSDQWNRVLGYYFQQPFGATDPIFHKDIAFYVFSLPFYLFVQKGLLLLVVLAGLLMLAWYFKSGALQVVNLEQFVGVEGQQPHMPKFSLAGGAKKQLMFLAAVVVLLLAWGYRLKMFGLLYSTAGAAFGAGYTDIHIKLPAYWVLIAVSIAFALMLFYNAFRARTRYIWISAGIWLGAIIVFASLVPLLVQKVVVKPNELAKESAYIAYNINYTRQAYNLNKIKEVSFPERQQLSMADIRAHRATIQNIRIWDKRPLLQTYRQLQSIRLYYDFRDVDVDRYHFGSEYRQVMLSAREFVANQLPRQANTWVNRHLIYTHGYGLTLNTVNDVTGEGLPNLLIKDLPPTIKVNLKIERPEIYYGEMTNDYVLVGTRAKEFDYPKGDSNVYTHYQGTGGIPLTSFARRSLYALEFLDPQILFTSYLGSQSRIMYNRRIDRRVRAIAPFLDYDADPYLVISGGKLYWVQDAYTTSPMYPYSQRTYRYFHKGINYIRNSVKITIDAYSGAVTFYMIDQSDPIVKTYASIFPRLFKPFNEMPADLKQHVRYPKDLFRIQAAVYRIFHMKNVKVFYNQEDLWQIPDEMYGDKRQPMQPYYIIVRLPGEEQEEFLLMLPFTPSGKDNMISWLAARNDMPAYGGLIVYKLPKDKLAFGPMQIEARIDQQTQISQELTLWGQRGSTVIRGNLLVIPIGDTFIYVEPVYLEARQSETSATGAPAPQSRNTSTSRSQNSRLLARAPVANSAALPELKRVIVSFGKRLAMRRKLDSALRAVLGKSAASAQLASGPASPVSRTANPARRALEHYQRAKAYLRTGDWAGYGRELKILENMLTEMAGAGKP